MNAASHNSTVIAVAVLTLCFIASIPTTAEAATDLAEELPELHDTVVIADFEQMRDSPLYDRAFELLENNPQAAGILRELDDNFGIAPRTDVQALAITSEAPPLNASILNDPNTALDEAANQQSDNAFVLIRGNFQAAEILERLVEGPTLQRESDDNSSSATGNGIEVHLTGESTLGIALGSSEFLSRQHQQLQEGPDGLNDEVRNKIQRLGSSQGLYLMVQPTIEDPEQMRQNVGAAASFVGLALDLKSQVDLAMVMDVDDDETASETVGDIDEMRQQGADNPMATLFGFGPVLENLSIEQQESEILMRTSMTNPEALRIVDQVGGIMQTEQQLGDPLEGDGFDTDQSDSDNSDSDGVDADFN